MVAIMKSTVFSVLNWNLLNLLKFHRRKSWVKFRFFSVLVMEGRLREVLNMEPHSTVIYWYMYQYMYFCLYVFWIQSQVYEEITVFGFDLLPLYVSASRTLWLQYFITTPNRFLLFHFFFLLLRGSVAKMSKFDRYKEIRL